MEIDTASFDLQVRRCIYEHTCATGLPPHIAQTAAALAASPEAVRAAYTRLAAGRGLVLQPFTGEILMANPFSAVPTPFVAAANGRQYFGNCIWDVLGIPAMLKSDAVITASCGDCGEAMNLTIRGGGLEPAPGVAHFAVPAAHWWDDIVYN